MWGAGPLGTAPWGDVGGPGSGPVVPPGVAGWFGALWFAANWTGANWWGANAEVTAPTPEPPQAGHHRIARRRSRRLLRPTAPAVLIQPEQDDEELTLQLFGML